MHYIEVVLPQARRTSFDSIEMFLASFSSHSPKAVVVFAGETPRGTLRKVRHCGHSDKASRPMLWRRVRHDA